MIPPRAPTFEAALRDVHAEGVRFRVAAARRLANPPDHRRQEAVDGLGVLSADRVGAVREAAYEALGEIGPEGFLDRLIEAFEDPHPGARQAAVLAARRVAPNRSTAAIEALLEDPRPEMRFSAVWALSRFGGLRPELVRLALRDADEEVRTLACECVGESGTAGHEDRLASLVGDPSDRVRFAASVALAKLADPRGLAVLKDSLRRRDRAFEAAVALGDLGDGSARTELAALATQRLGSPILRAAAARALARIGDPLGERVIRRILRSWRIEARQYAVELVGELGLVSLVPDLARALRRDDVSAHPVYETALSRLAPKSSEAQTLLASLLDANHGT